MKNRSSDFNTDTTCSHPGLCYDRLINQCAPCMNQSRRPNLNTTCHHSSLCYDRLIKQCVSCKHMQRATKKETATILETNSVGTQLPQLHIANQSCSALIFSFCAFVGLVIIMAMLWIVILKQKRRKGMRKAGKENSKENGNCIRFLVNEAPTGHGCRSGDYGPEQFQCPHSNGISRTTQEVVFKEKAPHIAVSKSQEFKVILQCPRDEKCNPTFPLPATELGATALVTTKTAQESIFREELPPCLL